MLRLNLRHLFRVGVSLRRPKGPTLKRHPSGRPVDLRGPSLTSDSEQLFILEIKHGKKGRGGEGEVVSALVRPNFTRDSPKDQAPPPKDSTKGDHKV